MFYPPAKRRNIRPGASDPLIVPVGVVLHVAATRARTLKGWFSGPSGGIESHLYLRRNGTWEQYRSLLREADAQFRGNSWVVDGVRYGFISVETQGLGPGRWSKRQLAALETFLLWASGEFGFPLRVVNVPQPSSPKAGGVGFHTLHKSWSNVSGKTCPGPRRIRQFYDVIAPWMRSMNCRKCPRHCPKRSS